MATPLNQLITGRSIQRVIERDPTLTMLYAIEEVTDSGVRIRNKITRRIACRSSRGS